MDAILSQLGGLLLGAVPTVIFMVLLYGFYSGLVYKPLAAVLAERYSRTEGALEKARADIAAAEARTADYEQRLREARAAIFKRQEKRRQQALQVRAAALAEARDRARAQVRQAREVMEKEKLSAQASLTTEATRLAAEIIRSVLRPAAPQPPASVE
jgi:F-type H+-transporting ATPase subunit b